jgi:hypothetical protein
VVRPIKGSLGIKGLNQWYHTAVRSADWGIATGVTKVAEMRIRKLDIKKTEM